MALNRDTFQPPRSIERSYQWAIQTIIDKLFKEFDYLDPAGYIMKIEEFVNTRAFNIAANSVASHMVTALATHNASSWREAASVGTRGREVHQAILRSMHGPIGNLVMQQIDHNAGLISSTPLIISQYISDYVLKQQESGRRAEDIARDLAAKIPELTKSRVALIARTEVSKSSTALTRAQSQDLGINWFAWRTSRDGRVRESHRKMDGVLVSWNDLPSPELLAGEEDMGRYGPGEIFNCRCFASPVISVNYLAWPCRVYSNGRIINNVGKTGFEKNALGKAGNAKIS